MVDGTEEGAGPPSGPGRGRRATLALLALALSLSACGARPETGPTTTTTTTTSSTTSTTVPRSTTTTTLPRAPATSPYAAAQQLIDSWVAGRRSRAGQVATAAAVSSLFAHAYAGETVSWRGCTSAFLPRVCTFGAYGGGRGTLYEVDLRPTHGRWYVSAVSVEAE
ncbi:MAG TPA: hypothetical protein VKV25_01460 [Acidimicrobiales bacterium]|nr:hypothetical protein [Acidimicrobiales bacterium]